MRASDRVRLALALALVTASVSCNAIVGLDSFEKVDDAGVEAGKLPDGGEFIQLPEGTLSTTWATWSVSETVVGTRGFSTAGGVFTPGGTGVAAVLDTTTNLVWLVETGFMGSFVEARDYCSAKPFGPWRLPSRIELVSLLDFSKTDHIDAALFPNFGREPTWTASPVRPLATALQYWAVNFRSGTSVLGKLNSTGNTNLGSVRCVKTKT